jgi:hypothetical protein
VALVVDAAFEVAGAGTETGAAREEGEVDAVAVETAGFGVEAWGETSRSVNRSFVRKPREGQKWRILTAVNYWENIRTKLSLRVSFTSTGQLEK